jgi:predicted transcriptional regulator of viral defense system
MYQIYPVASAQNGYFTSRQARNAGFSPRVQHYHWKQGHWRRVNRGVYRLRDYPASPHEDLTFWYLWSGEKAVVSHESAAAVHDLGDLLPGRIHLTVPPGFRKAASEGVILHRGRLEPADLESHEGFKITKPLQTITDLLRSGTESDRLAGLIRDALHKGAVTWAALDARIATLSLEYRDRAERVIKQVEGKPVAI